MAYKNPEKHREYNRKWRKEHPDRVKAHKRTYYERHVDRLVTESKERIQQWRKDHHEEALDRDRKWRERHPDKMKETQRKVRYKVTPEGYNQLLATQEGVCAICGGNRSKTRRTLAVDHDHSTGTIRGLLCRKCNLGLGCFEDNSEWLQNAINYINRSKEQAK